MTGLEAYLPAQQSSQALALQRFVGQFVRTNAKDVFHHHSDLLHELVAACRARLRDGAG